MRMAPTDALVTVRWVPVTNDAWGTALCRATWVLLLFSAYVAATCVPELPVEVLVTLAVSFLAHVRAHGTDPGVFSTEGTNASTTTKGRTAAAPPLGPLHRDGHACVKCTTFPANRNLTTATPRLPPLRPSTAHHCRRCRACVIGMDHHCPWISNCVGPRNKRYFLQFLVSTAWSGWRLFWALAEQRAGYEHRRWGGMWQRYTILFQEVVSGRGFPRSAVHEAAFAFGGSARLAAAALNTVAVASALGCAFTLTMLAEQAWRMWTGVPKVDDLARKRRQRRQQQQPQQLQQKPHEQAGGSKQLLGRWRRFQMRWTGQDARGAVRLVAAMVLPISCPSWDNAEVERALRLHRRALQGMRAELQTLSPSSALAATTAGSKQ